MPPRKRLTQIIDDRTDKRGKKEKPKEGRVLNVGPTTATVQLVGSATPIPCGFDPQSGVATGKRVTVEWMANARKYVITGVYGSISGGIAASDQAAANFILSPPSNFAADDGLPGSIVVTWDVPPQQDVAFEVQQNSSPDEVGATHPAGGITRGSMVIVASADTLYFRIRSITNNFHYSAWSDWVSSGPGAPSFDTWNAQETVVTQQRYTPANSYTLIIGTLDVQPGGEVDSDGAVYIVPEEGFL